MDGPLFKTDAILSKLPPETSAPLLRLETLRRDGASAGQEERKKKKNKPTEHAKNKAIC